MTAQDTEPALSPRPVQGAMTLLLLALGLLALTRVVRIYVDFSDPGELTYPTSVMIYHARDFQHGRPIYLDFRQSPHVLALYGPLSYIVPGALARWFDADDQGLQRIGRTLSLLYTAGSLIVLAVLLGVRERVASRPTLLMVLLFATAPILWPVSMCPRADAAETFFVLAGLAVFRFLEQSAWRHVCVVAFAIAFLFKQTALIAPGAIVLYLLLQRRWSQAVILALVSLVAFAAAFLVTNSLTGGLYALNNFAALRANVTLGNLATVMAEGVLLTCALPWTLAAFGLVRGWAQRPHDLYTVLLTVTFLSASAQTLRDGSGDNYFITSLALACVIGGRELQRWIATPGHGRQPALLALVAGLVLVLPPAGRAILDSGALWAAVETRAERDRAELESGQALARQLDALGGPILCQYDPLNLLCQNSILMDTLTLAGLADQGVFDDRAIIAMVRARRFAAIVLQFPIESGRVVRYQSTDTFRRAWVEAMLAAGYRATPVGRLYVYRPPS